MRLLVLVSSRIGDSLLVTPAIRALKGKFPDAHLEVRGHPKRMDVFRNNPHIDRLGSITPSRARFMGWVSGKRNDFALVFNPDTELERFALRVSDRVVAFGNPDIGRISDERIVRVQRPADSIHAVHERLLLVEAVGAVADGYSLDYVVSPEEREGASVWVGSRCGLDSRPLIGVQLQSFATKSHRDWPTEKFVDLLKRIRSRFGASRFVLLGDESGRKRAIDVARRLGDSCALAAGEMGLRKSAAIMAELDLYIGVDTGPTHIAGALGIPMVALYHCLYPGRNLAPLGHINCRIIEHPATGGGCSGFSDMGEISVDTVWTQVVQLLDGRTCK